MWETIKKGVIMKICLNRDVLQRIKQSSYYNDSVYKLPFSIDIDGICYQYLCESYQEVSNEYEYNLGYVDKDNYFIPDIFFMPRVHDDLKSIMYIRQLFS